MSESTKENLVWLKKYDTYYVNFVLKGTFISSQSFITGNIQETFEHPSCLHIAMHSRMKRAENFTDAELIVKLKSNGEEVMGMLYERYLGKPHISAFKILKDKQAAEDIRQKLFVDIWNKQSWLNIHSAVLQYLSGTYSLTQKKKPLPIPQREVNLVSLP